MPSFIGWSRTGQTRRRGGLVFDAQPRKYAVSVPAAVSADPYIVTHDDDPATLVEMVQDKFGVLLTADVEDPGGDPTGILVAVFT